MGFLSDNVVSTLKEKLKEASKNLLWCTLTKQAMSTLNQMALKKVKTVLQTSTPNVKR